MLKFKNYMKLELCIVFEGMLCVNFNKKMMVEGGMDGYFVDIFFKWV